MFIKNEEYQIHKYNTKLKVLSDYQFILEAFLRDKLIFYYINKPIVNFELVGVVHSCQNQKDYTKVLLLEEKLD